MLRIAWFGEKIDQKNVLKILPPPQEFLVFFWKKRKVLDISINQYFSIAIFQYLNFSVAQYFSISIFQQVSIKVSEFPQELWNLFTLWKFWPAHHNGSTKFRISQMKQEGVPFKAAGLSCMRHIRTKLGWLAINYFTFKSSALSRLPSLPLAAVNQATWSY